MHHYMLFQIKLSVVSRLVKKNITALIHHQGIIYGVAFDRSSLRRIDSYVSVVAPPAHYSGIYDAAPCI